MCVCVYVRVNAGCVGYVSRGMDEYWVYGKFKSNLNHSIYDE